MLPKRSSISKPNKRASNTKRLRAFQINEERQASKSVTMSITSFTMSTNSRCGFGTWLHFSMMSMTITVCIQVQSPGKLIWCAKHESLKIKHQECAVQMVSYRFCIRHLNVRCHCFLATLPIQSTFAKHLQIQFHISKNTLWSRQGLSK